MTVITVEELNSITKEAIKDGYGKREIYLADDEECNGYHGLFLGFSLPDKDNISNCWGMDPYPGVHWQDYDKVILLG